MDTWTKAKLDKWKRGIKERENFKFLTTTEINQSSIILLREAQLESFPNEYHLMSYTKPIPSNSEVISLSAIFDEGPIKVGGRIRCKYPERKQAPNYIQRRLLDSINNQECT